MEENEDIKKAKTELEKIKQDEREQYLAELRQKHIMDQKAIREYGFQTGYKSGLEQGLEKLKKEREKYKKEKEKYKQEKEKYKQEKEKIHKRLLKTGMKPEEIEKILS